MFVAVQAADSIVLTGLVVFSETPSVCAKQLTQGFSAAAR